MQDPLNLAGAEINFSGWLFSNSQFSRVFRALIRPTPTLPQAAVAAKGRTRKFLTAPGHLSGETLAAATQELRGAQPLVQCIANYVSMDIMANVLLAAGASPAMVHTKEEAIDFTALCGAVSINIGTLSPPWVESFYAVADQANKLG